MITKPLVLLVTVLLAVSSPVRTSNACQQSTYHALSGSLQQEDGWVAIKTDEGVLFVWNRPDIHFTIAIKGAEIKPLNDPEHIFLSVDGKVFQIQLASISEFAPDAKEKKLDDKSILAAHRDWESKYIEGLLHSKLKVQLFTAKLSSGSDASLWQFDMPEGMNADAKKQIYLTMVSKPYVLLLNSEATATISEDVARKFLLDTIATLKISLTPIDVKKLSESIRGGSKP
ncbi:MAG: hypothetical protein M3R67_03325 [Acidobacteriota bacterium]|nr:hypothetical protein [Acidobacteriota bacterium]